MYKLASITLEKEIEVVSEVSCNQCGIVVFKHDPPEKMSYEDVYVKLPADISDNGVHVEIACFGDHSASRFENGDEFNFYLCEGCLYDLVQSFALKPKITNRLKD